jgi:hypothetical protein
MDLRTPPSHIFCCCGATIARRKLNGPSAVTINFEEHRGSEQTPPSDVRSLAHLNHSVFHKKDPAPAKGSQENEAYRSHGRTREGFAMTFTVKMTMFLYAMSVGIISNGFHRFLVPH